MLLVARISSLLFSLMCIYLFDSSRFIREFIYDRYSSKGTFSGSILSEKLNFTKKRVSRCTRFMKEHF